MIAIDTNILVYAHREDSPWHQAALKTILSLAEDSAPWAIPWPCVHEFLAIVTHPKIYVPPTPLNTALQAIEVWFNSANLQLLGEGLDHFQRLKKLLTSSRVVGPRIHDARIAAICLSHGVRELWTADRDYTRFPNLKIRNPLVG